MIKMNKRPFSCTFEPFGALKNLNLIDTYVEYDYDGYEIEYPVDYEDRKYYEARYELVKQFLSSTKRYDITNNIYPFNPIYLIKSVDI
jgi:hypothetical protein